MLYTTLPRHKHELRLSLSQGLVSVARLSAQMPALRRLRLARNRLRRWELKGLWAGPSGFKLGLARASLAGVERLGDLPKLQLLDVSENLLGPTPGAAPGKIGSLGSPSGV